MRSLRRSACACSYALAALATVSPAARADDDNRAAAGTGGRLPQPWYGATTGRTTGTTAPTTTTRIGGYGPYGNWVQRPRGYGRYQVRPYYGWSRAYPWGW